MAAASAPTRVKVDVHENNARGFDADALDLLKAFAADRGPDIYVAAHEWIGTFVEAGYAMNLEEHIAANPEYYHDIIPELWESVKYKGERFGVPQDSEVRMFFYNKNMLRAIGKSDEFIEGLPARVESGEFTIYDLTDLAKEVLDGGAAKYGLVHPDEVISPYDLTLNTMPVADRRQWASRVLAHLGPHLDGVECVVFLAGRRYREFLELSLRSRGLVVLVPMEGLRIGEQLRWLTKMHHG